jgi:eukaryotic-like serine/threonine-protein kinase
VTGPAPQPQSLRARLARDGDLPVAEAARVLRAVASALAARVRDERNRPVTPDDVILSGGSATLARAGDTTRGSHAPPPDVIHELGALGYEMLTGRAPSGERPEPIEIRRPRAPTELTALIMRCLDPGDPGRPQSAADIVKELDDIGPLGADAGNPLARLLESDTLEARAEQFRRRGILTVSLVVLLFIALALFQWRRSAHENTAAAPPASVAVQPLDNAAHDPATQYLADGVTAELTAALERLPGVEVRSRNAAASLSGSIRRAGNRIQLAIRVTNVFNGSVLLSKSYGRSVADLFQVEDDVARSIARTLHVTPRANEPLAGRATTARAHDLYLEGRFEQRRRSGAGLQQSVALFGKALDDDSTYAPAWAGLATSWRMLSDDAVAPNAAAARLRQAVARGLAIDPTNAELKFSQGAVAYLFDRDARAAQQYMGAALAVNPDLPSATQLYPQVLWTNGLADSANTVLRLAVDRDSASADRLSDAWAYEFQTGNALAERTYCGQLLALKVGDRCDAEEKLDTGHADQALEFFHRAATAPTLQHVNAEVDYVRALLAARRIADARNVVAAVDREAATPGLYVREDDVALIHGLVGENDVAIHWYERALTAGSAGIGAFYWRTLANPLRKDPRAAAFARRAGLAAPPPYWP